MAKIYLEFVEDDLKFISSHIFTGEEDSDIFDEPDEERDETETIVFIPIHLYREPLVGTHELEVNFDTSKYARLHLVIARYSVSEQDIPSIHGKWHVVGVYSTRREAKEVQNAIEEDTFGDKLPWKKENYILEDLEVVTLPVED